MTQTTDTRQLRLLIEGIVRINEIDNLKLEIDLFNGIKRLLESDTPVRTREQYLDGIRNAMNKGTIEQDELEKIRTEIRMRARINPIGDEWEDFIQWARKQEIEKNEIITKFLDWYVSDEWRLAHPPINPRAWFVQWPQAFKQREEIIYGRKSHAL